MHVCERGKQGRAGWSRECVYVWYHLAATSSTALVGVLGAGGHLLLRQHRQLTRGNGHKALNSLGTSMGPGEEEEGVSCHHCC